MILCMGTNILVAELVGFAERDDDSRDELDQFWIIRSVCSQICPQHQWG